MVISSGDDNDHILCPGGKLDLTHTLKMIHMQQETANPIQLLQQEAPEAADAFDKLIQAIINSKGLDEKTKQLIYIAMKATQGDTQAVSMHILMAKNAGATKAEMIDALLVTLTVAGIKGIVTGLPAVVHAFDTGSRVVLSNACRNVKAGKSIYRKVTLLLPAFPACIHPG